MTWTISILISVSCLTAHILAVKILGEKFPASFATPAFYTFAVVLLYALFLYEKPKVNYSELWQVSVVLPLVIAGFTIGLTDFFFVKALNLGADASTAMPVLVGGAAIMVAILAFVIFKEALSPMKALGILMSVAGIFMIYKG